MHARMTTIGLALLMLVCGPAAAVTIADVTGAPGSWEGKTVTVTGKVERSVPLGSEGAFDLRDGAARMTVFSRAGAPTPGSLVSVTGRVYVFHEGDAGDPESNTFPPMIVESSRAPAP
jgi:hypothetical protein